MSTLWEKGVIMCMAFVIKFILIFLLYFLGIYIQHRITKKKYYLKGFHVEKTNKGERVIALKIKSGNEFKIPVDNKSPIINEWIDEVIKEGVYVK